MGLSAQGLGLQGGVGKVLSTLGETLRYQVENRRCGYIENPKLVTVTL